MIACCSESKPKTWILVRCAMGLDGNLVMLLHWKKRKKVSKNVLRNFPLIPRLQRLYAVESTTKDMRWHAEEHRGDGILSHPADSDAWKEFNKKHVESSLEPHNVRLGWQQTVSIYLEI